MLAPPAPRRVTSASEDSASLPDLSATEATTETVPAQSEPAAPVLEAETPTLAAEDNAAPVTAIESDAPEPLPSSPPEPAPAASSPAAAPLFRARSDLGKASSAPAVIPILRAPDDPGIDDEAGTDEFAEQIGSPKAQAGGWRGFLTRWGG